jgi:hypothetical protein
MGSIRDEIMDAFEEHKAALGQEMHVERQLQLARALRAAEEAKRKMGKGGALTPAAPVAALSAAQQQARAHSLAQAKAQVHAQQAQIMQRPPAGRRWWEEGYMPPHEDPKVKELNAKLRMYDQTSDIYQHHASEIKNVTTLDDDRLYNQIIALKHLLATGKLVPEEFRKSMAARVAIQDRRPIVSVAWRKWADQSVGNELYLHSLLLASMREHGRRFGDGRFSVEYDSHGLLHGALLDEHDAADFAPADVPKPELLSGVFNSDYELASVCHQAYLQWRWMTDDKVPTFTNVENEPDFSDALAKFGKLLPGRLFAPRDRAYFDHARAELEAAAEMMQQPFTDAQRSKMADKMSALLQAPSAFYERLKGAKEPKDDAGK